MAVAADMSFSHLAASGSVSCGLEVSTGTAWCWGDGEWGALGSSDEAGSATPKRTLGDQVFLYMVFGATVQGSGGGEGRGFGVFGEPTKAGSEPGPRGGRRP